MFLFVSFTQKVAYSSTVLDLVLLLSNILLKICASSFIFIPVEYSIRWMYPSLFNLPFPDGNLGCF